MFKDRLRELRKQLHMTQSEFAKMLGVNLKSVINWEKGEDPSLENFKNICIKTRESADYLLELPAERQVNIGDFLQEDQQAVISFIQRYRETIAQRDR